MDWFKTTSAFWSHPKVWSLKDRPFRVLVSSWGFSAQHGTGGRITRPALEQIKGKQADADALVAAGLWHEDGPDAWRIHEWDDHQAGAIKAEEKKARDRERLRAKRSGGVARQSRDELPRQSRLEEKREEEKRGEPPLPPSRDTNDDPPPRQRRDRRGRPTLAEQIARAEQLVAAHTVNGVIVYDPQEAHRAH